MTFNLPLYKNFGDEVRSLSPVLYNQMSEMYTDIANNLSDAIKRDIVTGANPAASSQRNTFFTVGDITGQLLKTSYGLKSLKRQGIWLG